MLRSGMSAKQPCVYIVTNRKHGTLYVGVTSNLVQRVAQHKAGTFAGFSDEHGLGRLVWFLVFDEMSAAIEHEKRLKRWRRHWKVRLIERDNPDWADLYDEVI